MAKAMRGEARLARRGAVYYFRARVPDDLKRVIGKHEIIESLRTKDKREAQTRARIRSLEVDAEFTRLRRERDKPMRTRISEEEIARIVTKATATRLGADEEGRIAGMSDEDFARSLKWLAIAEEHTTPALSRGQILEPLHERIVDWLTGHGYDLPRESEDYRRFAFAFAKAQSRATRDIQARNRGEAIDTPAMPKGAEHAATMEQLRDYWTAQKKPRPKTCIEADSILRRFAKANGELAPATVKRRHVVAFRDALVKEGRAPGTVKKLLGLLSGMFQVAVEDEQFGLESNPARDVKVRGEVGEAKARKHFSVDDLRAIFASPVFTQGERPRAGAGEAAFWIPLLGLFTGARLNEIGQLRPQDVKTEDGITFIHFTNQGEGMQLKRGGKSRKRVPVHEGLKRLGFIEYAGRMREARSDKLFPGLKPDSHGHITGRWSKWFNRYLDEVVGVTDSEKDFHSFRHTFKHHARVCGIPEDQHDALTGHANKSVSRAYGGAEGYPLNQLADAIARYEVPTLDLTRVCVIR